MGNVEPPREGQSSNIGIGRIVHFFAPKDNSNYPVSSGIAVIDCGEYAGQRVEFEAAQCEAFGCSLEAADLSQIFSYSKFTLDEYRPESGTAGSLKKGGGGGGIITLCGLEI